MSRLFLLLSLSLAACTVGSDAPPPSPTKTPQVIYVDQPVCADPIVDSNGDGIPDGLDLDCDGTVDITFGGYTGGGGSGTTGGGSSNNSSCQTQVSINGNSHAVDCTTSDGTDWSCTCHSNGTTSTCSTTSNDPCSIPGGNCCGF